MLIDITDFGIYNHKCEQKLHFSMRIVVNENKLSMKVNHAILTEAQLP